MGFWSKIFKKSASNSHELNQLIELMNASISGINVNAQTALKCPPVFSSVKVVAETIALLPFILYEKDDKKKKPAVDHPLYDLLENSPNEFQTSTEFRQLMMLNAQLHDHAFAFVNRVNGVVKEIIPLPSEAVKINRKNDSTIEYVVKQEGGGQRVLKSSEVFRVSGFPGDVTGIYDTAISNLKDSIGLTKAIEQFGSLLFANGARPGGILKVAKQLSPEAKKKLKTQIQDGFSGDSAFKAMLLDEGMEWQNIGYNAEEAQSLDSRKYQRSETAGTWGVPGYKIGDLEKATYSNIEHQQSDFISSSGLIWGARLEQAVKKYLLTKEERKTYFASLQFDELLRGDIETRFKAHGLAITYGICNANEIREVENKNPREDAGGDTYMRPANLVPSDGSEPSEDPDKSKVQ